MLIPPRALTAATLALEPDGRVTPVASLPGVTGSLTNRAYLTSALYQALQAQAESPAAFWPAFWLDALVQLGKWPLRNARGDIRLPATVILSTLPVPMRITWHAVNYGTAQPRPGRSTPRPAGEPDAFVLSLPHETRKTFTRE